MKDYSAAFMNPLMAMGLQQMGGYSNTMGQNMLAALAEQRQQQLTQSQSLHHQAQAQEAARAQLFAHALPEALQNLGATNVADATAKLMALPGADPKLALDLAKGIQPDIKDRFNPVTGEIVRFQNGMTGGVSQNMPQAQGMPAPKNQMGNAPMQNNVYPNANPNLGYYANSPKAQMQQLEADRQEQKDISKEERKKMEQINTDANAAALALGTIKQMQELANNFYQGPGAPLVKNVGKVANAVGLPDLGAASAETFEAESKQLLLDLNTKLKGATSDKDVILLKSAAPELEKTPEGNKNLLNALEAQYTRANQYAEAAETYYNQHHTLKGFDVKWRKYANAFPLINKTKSGLLDINMDNLNNWPVVLEEDFDRIIGPMVGASRVNPAQSAPSKFKAQNGHIYTKEEIDAALRGE
jgi:hypothetical protein